MHNTRAANDLCSRLYKLVDKDIVVDRVSNRTTNDTNGKRQGRDGGNQVIRANDGGDDGRGDYNATDSKTRNDENAVYGTQIIQACCCKGATACCHETRRNEQEDAVTAAELGEQPQHDACADEDGEADWHASQADADGVVAVYVEGLGGPEEQHGEEVCAGDEGDNEREEEDAWLFFNAAGKHGVLGAVDFPEDESDE